MAAMRLGRPVKWTEDRREHFISSAHERGQEQHISVGFDDDGRILALDVTFWHDNGAYTPYGIICPIVTSTQLLGPYKPGAYRVEFYSRLHHHGDRHAVPRRRAAAGRASRWSARWTGSPRRSGWTGPQVRAANFIQPDEFPYDQGLIFQDGRPLIYDSGNYPAQLEMIKDMIGWDDFERVRAEAAARGPAARHRASAATSRAPAPARTRARTSRSQTDGSVEVATGLTSQGQGHQTVFAQIVADELGRAVRVGPGDHRRHPPVRLRRRHVRLPGRGDVRLRGRAGGARGAGEGAADRGRRAGGAADDLEIVDGVVAVKGNPTASIPLGQVAVLSNPLRYAFDEAAKAATQFARPADPNARRSPRARSRGWRHATTTRRRGRRSPPACTPRSSRSTRTPARSRIVKYCVVHDCGTLINPMIVEGQVHGGVAQGIGGALYETDGLRRARAAAQRLVHGLPDAVRHRGAATGSKSTTRRRRRR